MNIKEHMDRWIAGWNTPQHKYYEYHPIISVRPPTEKDRLLKHTLWLFQPFKDEDKYVYYVNEGTYDNPQWIKLVKDKWQ
jgi:hypothetical protein